MQISFQTLKEFSEYVPNCIICRKTMDISIDSILGPVPGLHKRWASARESVHLKMSINEGILQSKHKSYKLHINPEDNIIVEGIEFATRFNSESTYVKKTCPTCHFKIHSVCPSRTIKKEKRFPALSLLREELHFTMRGGKDLHINKGYSINSNNDDLANIQLNRKYLPPVPLNFNKFTSFEQLINRINTIILFH